MIVLVRVSNRVLRPQNRRSPLEGYHKGYILRDRALNRVRAALGTKQPGPIPSQSVQAPSSCESYCSFNRSCLSRSWLSSHKLKNLIRRLHHRIRCPNCRRPWRRSLLQGSRLLSGPREVQAPPGDTTECHRSTSSLRHRPPGCPWYQCQW